VRIPIRNLYYLLCYAWDVLPESSVAQVGIERIETGMDLLSRVLINGVTHLRRRGLMRDYAAREDEVAGVRGKLHVAETLKRHLLVNARTHCAFDELEFDTLPNRIVKATLRLLSTSSAVDVNLRSELAGLYHSLGGVSDLALTRSAFAHVQLHRNIAFYALLLSVCRFAYESALPEEGGASSTFRDFERDERRMRELFQAFAFNFFKREQGRYQVESRQVKWSVTADDPGALEWLPRMQTDIVLTSKDRTIIIDTKFYAEAFQSSRFGGEKVRSEHLYQMMSYVVNWRHGIGQPEGILLYPTVRREFDFQFRICGIPIRVCSIDLDQRWPRIREGLLTLIKPASAPLISLGS
jgi:5-methylcytosine-specific restriction enzyme subunit McrC